MALSSSTPSRETVRSRLHRESMAFWIAFSTMLPRMSMSSWISRSRRSSSSRAICSFRLSEPPGDIVLRPLVVGLGEDPLRRPELDYPPRPIFGRQHEGRLAGDPSRLLHVVGNDKD